MLSLRDTVIYGFSGLSALLYVALLNRLLKYYARPYFGLLLYVTVLLLTLVTDLAAFKSANRSQLYLISETLRWAALYLAVLSFVWKALSSHPAKHWIRHWLIAASILAVVVALYFSRNPHTPAWILNTISILSVVGMALNLILWVLLIRVRSSDLTLFLVTSGLGVQAALEAAAWSMRKLNNRPVFEAAYYIAFLGHLLCLLVWMKALQPKAQPAVRA